MLKFKSFSAKKQLIYRQIQVVGSASQHIKSVTGFGRQQAISHCWRPMAFMSLLAIGNNKRCLTFILKIKRKLIKYNHNLSYKFKNNHFHNFKLKLTTLIIFK